MGVEEEFGAAAGEEAWLTTVPMFQLVLVKLSRPPELSVRVLVAAIVTAPTATLLVAMLFTSVSRVIEDAPVPSLTLSVLVAAFVTMVAGEYCAAPLVPKAAMPRPGM